jgi:hypothetical protein
MGGILEAHHCAFWFPLLTSYTIRSYPNLLEYHLLSRACWKLLEALLENGFGTFLAQKSARNKGWEIDPRDSKPLHFRSSISKGSASRPARSFCYSDFPSRLGDSETRRLGDSETRRLLTPPINFLPQTLSSCPLVDSSPSVLVFQPRFGYALPYLLRQNVFSLFQSRKRLTPLF